MKKLIPILFIIVLLAAFASAENQVQVGVTPIKDVIAPEEEASFSLTFTNPLDDDTFRVYYGGVEWDVAPRTFSLDRGQSQTFTFVIRPLYANPGQHAIPLTIKNDRNEIKQVTLLVNIRTKEDGQYLPSVSIAAEMPSSLSPNETLDLALTITNRNPRDISGAQVNIDSEFFSHTETINLAPTTKTNTSAVTIYHSFDVPNTALPQTTPIVFSVVYEGKTIALQQRGITFEHYAPGFTAEVEVDRSLFKTTKTVILTNEGNVEQKDSYRETIPLFRGIFSNQEPDASVLKEGGDRYLFWEFTLQPGEVKEVQIVTNYRPFILFLILIIGGGALYFILRSPLNISKHAQVIETKEGGISMLKVIIRIRNISSSSLEQVKIYDKVPHLADYFKEEQIGTLQPDKVVKSESKGAVVSWDVGTLEPLEERIITYKIRTQLNILGGLTLPSTRGKFKTHKGKQRVTSSALFKLSMKQ